MSEKECGLQGFDKTGPAGKSAGPLLLRVSY